MSLRPQILLCLAALAALSGGCVITSTTGDDARNARLPTGVTLLDSDRNQCAGAVTIDDGSIASAQRSDLVIQPGQDATFRVEENAADDVEIDWTCVGSVNAERSTAECPDDTEYVRITRDDTGSAFLLECFGDRD